MKLLIFSFILLTTPLAQANQCWIYLAESKGIAVTDSVTDNFIAFLDVMLNEHVINDDYLTKLAKGDLSNPLDKPLITESNHHIYKDIFQDFINAKLDKSKVTQWAIAKLKERTQTQQGKDQSKDKTQEAFIEMQFHRVESGDFVFNRSNKDYKVQLTEDFEMMSTSVTQKMWKDVMGKLPSQELIGNDYPVVNITWWSAIAFANKLSEKHNLPPAYDLSAIKDWTGNPAEGNWQPKDEIEASELLKVNATNGLIYFAKGFRLPTSYEAIYINSDRGRSNKKAFTNIDESNAHLYGNFGIENGLRTVGEYLPFIIDGAKFYDLYGNASEWLHDLGLFWDNFQSGTNVVDLIANNGKPDKNPKTRLKYRLIRGNDFTHDIINISSAAISASDTKNIDSNRSFRLVRSLPK